ncbi:amidoligase family protein [Alkalilacustris brevis]|uniref:amidoligase family protein n=1 Tax=Alkalilacustris brevis TaxID=2026338 RepID=UPI000E0D4956|nr:amidoligase family protein [Alkalilacustris brevis]
MTENTGKTVTERLSRSEFWPPPRPRRADGRPRRTGIEIEFAGLSVPEAAGVVQRLWGGEARADGPQRMELRGTSIGEVEVLLDTALARHGGTPLADAALELSRAVVPVEVVLPPLALSDLPESERLVRALRAAGAEGTREALAYGFGVHLNPELPDEEAATILPVIRAYALLEDWLRSADPIDPARSVLPFVDPYPRGFVDLLASEAQEWSINELAGAYLEHTPSRNRGLDALPLLEHLRPDMVRAALGAGAKGGRPTWHYRLPEARINEPGWSLAYEWNRWCIVERVAARPVLLAKLADAWQAHRASLVRLRSDWAVQVEAMLREARIWQP